MPDFDKMTGGNDLHQYCGMDASKWAAAFCHFAKKQGLDVDEGWMIGWFANAIMHTHDTIKGISTTVLPDGSAFFVAEV